MVYNTLVEKVKTVMNIAICDNDMDFVLKLKACIDDYLARSNLAGVYELFSSPAKLPEAEILGEDVGLLCGGGPVLNGIEAAGLLRRKYPDVVLVFVTDYIEYAPAGYRGFTQLKTRSPRLRFTARRAGQKL